MSRTNMPERQGFIPEQTKLPAKSNGVERLARRALHESSSFLSTQILGMTTDGYSKFDFNEAAGRVNTVAGPYGKTNNYDDKEIRRRLRIINSCGPIVRNGLYKPESRAKAVITICDLALEENITSEKLSRDVPRVKYLRYLTRDTSVLEPLLELDNKDDLFEKIFSLVCSVKIPETEKTALIEFCLTHSVELRQKIKEEPAMFKFVEVVAEYGNDQQWVEIENEITNKELLVAHLILSKLDKARTKGEKIIEPMLAGLDKSATIKAWLQSAAENTRWHPSFIERNLKAIAELRKAALNDEVIKTLNKEFDIFDFARYPTSVLLAQYEQREANIPYGILVFPRYDHGGHMYRNHDHIESLFGQLQGKFGMRIVETHGKFDMGRKLVMLDKKYGIEHKIEFAFIGAHGNTDVIGVGESDTQGALTTSDIKKKNKAGAVQLRKVKDCFVPKPTVVIGACLTGVPEGIGQNLSELLDGEVIAPDNGCNLASITVDVANNRPEFSATYYGANAKRYISGVDTKI